MPDHYYRQHEISEISKHLRNGVSVLDVGCGNGYSTLRFAETFPDSTFAGLDYSTEMIAHVNAALAETHFGDRVSFEVGDVLVIDQHFNGASFDTVMSEGA